MPQHSYAFAVANIRAKEGNLLNKERIERLVAQPTPEDALRLLREMGYGDDTDSAGVDRYEEWIRQELADTARLIEGLTPEKAATDCFLLRNDFLNLKILFKSRVMGKEPPPAALAGTLDYAALIRAVYNDDMYAVPEYIKRVVEGLNKRLALEGAPNVIDNALDTALFRAINANLPSVKSAEVVRYFNDWADMLNVITALRIKRAGKGRDAAAPLMVECGLIPPERIMKAVDDMGALKRLFAGRALKAALEEALSRYERAGDIIALEAACDDHLLRIFKKTRWRVLTIEPVIGYMLAKEREAAAIRLIMVGKINDFPPEALMERLRELYV